MNGYVVCLLVAFGGCVWLAMSTPGTRNEQRASRTITWAIVMIPVLYGITHVLN